MKLIIAGSRHLQIEDKVIQNLISELNIPVTEVICGGAKGIDKCGKEWAVKNNIKVRDFPALWKIYGRGAGPVRNKEMAKYADALLLIWDGKSRGSKNMKNEMEKIEKIVYSKIV